MKHVIARYKEDVTWAKDLNHVILQKGADMPNVGREPASYFFFIVKHYHELEGEYVFLQGYPYDHGYPNEETNYYGIQHTSDINGNPDHGGLPIQEVLTELGLNGSTFVFNAGCQFKVSAEQIKKRPIEFYLKCLMLCCMDDRYPYVFERIVPIIFEL